MLPHSAMAAYRASMHMTASPEPRAINETAVRNLTEQLQLRVDRQNLIIQTLLMILLEKKVIFEDEFREWMDYVDGLDGSRDGRLKDDKSPLSCPECQRNSPQSALKCVYCGHSFEPDFLLYRTMHEAMRAQTADKEPGA